MNLIMREKNVPKFNACDGLTAVPLTFAIVSQFGIHTNV